MRVSTNDEIKELNEADRNCLKYSKIGIVPKEAVIASKKKDWSFQDPQKYPN
ncbi:hypothetical protein C2G38_2256604 [Gigaspora rosea]|uniref:Uncharacterized protein n=1 Tax=Gigaspora rosea TaxID=44941 RepID=A0A397TV77_9GLOM|nr:hypothetical protein C2G38_2256604 [Gigaspora rosea]